MMCPMGMKVERIHKCPNDYVLFRKNYKNLHECPKCGVSRYKRKDRINCERDNIGPPTKVVWYFSIIPRLKCLFANAKDVKLLLWHAEGRIQNGKLRHPADSPQCRNIDSTFSKFGADPRNLKFGLSTDGMNPFGNMSSRHST